MVTINISEAKSRFSEFLSRAAGGERFVILRSSRSLAAIISAGDLERLERAAQIPRKPAQTLGQSSILLGAIDAGKTHPARLPTACGRMNTTWLSWRSGWQKTAPVFLPARLLIYEIA
jgi:prevent-host-death family protein